MALTLNAQTREGHTSQVTIDDHPNTCPICHASIQPQMIVVYHVHDAVPRRAEIVYRCARLSCQSLFVGYFVIALGGSLYALGDTEPSRPKRYAFPAEIVVLSPTFDGVYNQAVAAETYRLDQLAGTGFRKALEFLVKDFAIAQRPEDKDAIERSLLGGVIERYIDDARVKATAKRAAWIGNDETHYIRKWEGKDIQDLKTLIRLTVNWIENVLLTAHYTKDMPDPS
jgi:hypothetical protein